MTNTSRLDQLLQANREFQARIDPTKLPARAPEPLAIITCIDPRINLEALGIGQFLPNGAGQSDARIIRTIGGMADERSLLIGIFLAGFREFVVLMHTDCGCCLAHSKIDVIAKNMEARLDSAEFTQFKSQFTPPFPAALAKHLKTFDDPRTALKREIAAIHAHTFTPADLIVHGLLYDTATGAVTCIVNGYDEAQA